MTVTPGRQIVLPGKGLEDCRSVLQRAVSAGYKAPKSLSTPFAVYDKLSKEARSYQGLDHRSLTVENCVAAVAESQRAWEFSQSTKGFLETEFSVRAAYDFAEALRGGEGSKMLDAMRPSFEAAAAGIAQARLHGLHNGSTGEEVLEKGDEAIAAWRELPRHAARLNQVYGFITALDRLGVYQDLSHLHDSRDIKASKVLARLNQTAASAFGELNNGKGRVWLRLMELGGELRLNSPAEADALLLGERGFFQEDPEGIADVGTW